MSRRRDAVARLYAPRVARARARITGDPRLAELLSPSASDRATLGFLIEFCAGGVEMTRPVEGWIAAAGRRCEACGEPELGRELVRHAAHEADHHLLLIADLHRLVGRWNLGPGAPLDAEALLARPPSASTLAYQRLHEATIAGPAPHGQLAIEYEIERMSTVLGPALIDASRRTLGPGIDDAMRFVHEHARLDVGHTAHNEAALDRLLTARPELAAELAAVGTAGLHLYLDFLGECVTAAQAGLG